MNKFSPEYLSLADELLSQYALTQDDQLSGILTKENLPLVPTLCVGMHTSPDKLVRHFKLIEVTYSRS